MDYKKAFERFEDKDAFIKTTVLPPVDGAQKAALNRKGNILFNSGDIEGASRIFLTTRYSDGLSRVGDHYMSQHRAIEALRMYWLASDRAKYEPLLMRLAAMLQDLIHEEEGLSDE
ncbi:MAG: hypothetical protein LBK62_02620 [Treponema sp.]|jgi:hypothetical protein|nr:hypothetical protein [Treponema sp.]